MQHRTAWIGALLCFYILNVLFSLAFSLHPALLINSFFIAPSGLLRLTPGFQQKMDIKDVQLFASVIYWIFWPAFIFVLIALPRFSLQLCAKLYYIFIVVLLLCLAGILLNRVQPVPLKRTNYAQQGAAANP
jgi:hypothetical protein